MAKVGDGGIESWRVFDVGWGRLHAEDAEGLHHARIARFLQEQHVELVVANHMGAGMSQMLAKMQIPVRLEATGPAQQAVLRSE